ncbi:hypothetical protein [Catenuloplanes atrovinosus]|uniref:Uncharacterized protein n=1 Tax=Catenuloplanes atrovinosus TaxID=137266 RepID=A0AAE3YLV5_9ACTN|nr:hypothetical protein [Catenuloplanes atrovinosus]MDR7275915.1 hypothetical protein [Catenuloplanes atrovinosus]
MTFDATDAVRAHLRRVLLHNRDLKQRRLDRIAAVESAGHRIISGGRTHGAQWSLHDWRTGETIASGEHGIDEFDEVRERLDPGDAWVHIDEITFDPEPYRPIDAEGLPGDLGIVLQQWVSGTGTSSAALAAFVGWPVERVEECR